MVVEGARNWEFGLGGPLLPRSNSFLVLQRVYVHNMGCTPGLKFKQRAPLHSWNCFALGTVYCLKWVYVLGFA